MKPLGRKPSRFPGKEDCHPKKGYVNWWEAEILNDENKTADKLIAKKEIDLELLSKAED